MQEVADRPRRDPPYVTNRKDRPEPNDTIMYVIFFQPATVSSKSTVGIRGANIKDSECAKGGPRCRGPYRSHFLPARHHQARNDWPANTAFLDRRHVKEVVFSDESAFYI